MDDTVSIEKIHGGHDAVFEFLFGCDADVAQHRTSELGEEPFNEIEPGTVRGREGEFEAAGGLLCKPGLGLLGEVCRMIVEDQLDRGMARIGSIDKLQEFDELAAAMAVPDQGVNLAGQQIDAGQQADRATTFVFMIAGEGRVSARLGRQVRRGRRNRLPGSNGPCGA